MFTFKAVLVLLATLAFAFLIQGTSGSVVRPLIDQLHEQTREEIVRLAKRIGQLGLYGLELNELAKRNGGTADAIYNLPDLEKIGKK